MSIWIRARDASGSPQRSGICSSLVGKIGLLVVSSEWENMVAYVHLIQHIPPVPAKHQ